MITCDSAKLVILELDCACMHYVTNHNEFLCICIQICINIVGSKGDHLFTSTWYHLVYIYVHVNALSALETYWHGTTVGTGMSPKMGEVFVMILWVIPYDYVL